MRPMPPTTSTTSLNKLSFRQILVRMPISIATLCLRGVEPFLNSPHLYRSYNAITQQTLSVATFHRINNTHRRRQSRQSTSIHLRRDRFHRLPLFQKNSVTPPQFQSFRSCSGSITDDISTTAPSTPNDTNPAPNNPNAQKAFSKLCRKHRTWARLRNLVHLTEAATTTTSSTDNVCDKKVIADIGCDHGLLSIALASSNRYDKVIASDVSQRALEDGALVNYQKFKDYYTYYNNCDGVSGADPNPQDGNISSENSIPRDVSHMEFRVGDGLQSLKNNEVDSLCLAGMGIQNMLQILFAPSSQLSSSSHDENADGIFPERTEMERVGCTRLFLQPAFNSRPRHFIKLYDALQKAGWRINGELVEKVSSRMFMSVSFVKERENESTSGCDAVLPGHLFLSLEPEDEMYQTYVEYVTHHRKWIMRDVERDKKNLWKEDVRWLDSDVSNL